MNTNKDHLDHLDRYDDRYITTKAGIYYFGAISTVVISFVIWVFSSIAELKTKTEVQATTIVQLEKSLDDFYTFHKEQIDILNSKQTDINDKIKELEHKVKPRNYHGN